MKNAVGMFAFVALAAVVGCGGREQPGDGAWRPTMKNPPVREVKVGKPMPVPRMKDDDVIVAVNGICLTKRMLDDSLLAYDWHLGQDRRIRGNQRQTMYRNYGRRLIPSFVDSQALLWEAREKCHLEYTNVVAVAETNVIRNAKSYGMTPEQYDQRVPGGNNAVRAAAEQLLWREAYLTQVFKPTTVITSRDVAQVLAQIDAENAEIAASNAVVRARLEKIRTRIVTGGEDFGKLADEFGEDAMQAKDGTGTWGDISPSDVTGDDTAEKMFALKAGQVSGTLEDDEGYFIVKALADPTKDEDGKMSIKLARIWMAKTPLVVLADASSLKKDMQQQINDRELGKHIAELRKKVTVVYPHGTNFWNESK